MTSSRWSVLLWNDYGCFLIELSIFNFFLSFTGPELQSFSVFELSRACWLWIKKALNQAKIYQDLIQMVSISLGGLLMVSDKIVDFQCFVKFHRSGPASF